MSEVTLKRVKRQMKNKDNMDRTKWLMDEKEFASIKRMLAIPKLGVAQIAKLTGWSEATIWKVSNSKTLADYRAYNKARQLAKTKPAPALQKAAEALKEAPKPLDGVTHYDKLERIAVALERLADAWENAPTKKTGFFG